MGKVVSFINYKGGVGKTTTTYHIGCALAMVEPRKRVLLIDADPQTNLTFLCSDFDAWEKRLKAHGSLETLYAAHIENRKISIRDILWKQPMKRAELGNVDLVPASAVRPR